MNISRESTSGKLAFILRFQLERTRCLSLFKYSVSEYTQSEKMMHGVDNPALNHTDGDGEQDGRDVCSFGVANHTEVILRPSFATDTDVGMIDTKRCSSTEDSNASTHDNPILSRWPWKIIHVITGRPGILLALVAALFYSGKGILLKLVSERINAFQSVVMIMPMMFILSSLGIVITQAHLPKQKSHYPWLLLNGISSSLVLTTYTLAISYMDVSDVVAVSYSSLVFVCLLSWIILKEPLGIFDFVFSFIALAGVVFIARPYPLFGQSNHDSNASTSNYILGVAFALGTALGIAIGVNSFKKQTQLEINKFVSMFAVSCVVTFTNVVISLALNQWRAPDLLEWIYAIGSGLCYFLAFLSCLTSLKLETPTMVSIILTFEIVFAFLWQFVILDVSPAWTSYVGSLLLVIASIGITMYKNRRENRQQTHLKKTKRKDSLKDSIEIS